MTKPLHTISSTASMKVFGTTGPVDTGGASFYNKTASASDAGAFGAPCSVGGWTSLSSKKTASFSTIQTEVIQTVTSAPGDTYEAYNPAELATQELYSQISTGPRRIRPGVPTTGNGETPPATGELLPLGDMLIPMLIIALGYIVVKLFRNRKTSQAL
jgi:hypothetical protein